MMLVGGCRCRWRLVTKYSRLFFIDSSPVVLRHGNTSVEDFCNNIHKTIMREFKCAIVWGSSAKHQPQRVGKDHILQDEDVVQIVKRIG